MSVCISVYSYSSKRKNKFLEDSSLHIPMIKASHSHDRNWKRIKKKLNSLPSIVINGEKYIDATEETKLYRQGWNLVKGKFYRRKNPYNIIKNVNELDGFVKKYLNRKNEMIINHFRFLRNAFKYNPEMFIIIAW